MKKAVRVHPGERVYVTGNTPSGLPRDRTVTFRYDKDGEPVIHSFTVLDAYVFGDFGGGMGIGDIIKSLDPPPGGLQLPVGSPQRQVNLQPYAFLPGKTLVTLGGTPGAIRLNIPYNNTKLEYGQVLTNPPPIATYAEALAPGAASIDIAFQGEDVATNYTCSFSLPVTVVGLRFVETSETVYNFSPSLEETAKVRVEVIPYYTPSLSGCTFQMEIVRELQNAPDQHIDWVNVDPGNVGYYTIGRAVDFSAKTFAWDGIPEAPPVGASAPIATGRDVFQGVSDSVNIKFPVVTYGQPVPPPFYTAVARIRQGSTILCEARKRIFVPQVVKMAYNTDAVDLMKAGKFSPDGSTKIVEPMTGPDWDFLRAGISGQVKSLFPPSVNVRVVSETQNVTGFYQTLRLTIKGNLYGLGETPNNCCDYLNEKAGTLQKTATIHVYHIQGMAEECYNNTNITFGVVSPSEFVFAVSRVGAHEMGHMLGLAADNKVLNGDINWHNKERVPINWIMNGRVPDKGPLYFKRGDKWEWNPLNEKYLEFILPVE